MMSDPHAVEADRLLTLVTKEAEDALRGRRKAFGNAGATNPHESIAFALLALCALGRATLANDPGRQR